MKKLIMIIILVAILLGCRSYTVNPQQIAIVTDPETLEQILQSDCFQSMGFSIRVEGVTVEKSLEAVVDVAP